MFEIRCILSEVQADAVEAYGCELSGISPWTIRRDKPEDPNILSGFFTDKEALKRGWDALNAVVKDLPNNPETHEIDDVDWKERYKDFLDVWEHKGLAWVPVWKKNVHSTTERVRVLYDAGMAFGTGDHPTTQLCAMRLMEFGNLNAADFHRLNIIDAGCGSGILAITAYKLGCQQVYGFDHDSEAIKVCHENSRLNDIEENAIEFKEVGIEEGLADRGAHFMMANIQSDVLCIYAENFALAMEPRGTLVLSGILSKEKDECEQRFQVAFERLEKNIRSITSRNRGDWADICIHLG